MTWSYSGNPASSDMDKVRWLIGDTATADQLVTNEEITAALVDNPQPQLAAAACLRALAALFSRRASRTVGSVSIQLSDVAKAFSDRAKELDPSGATSGAALPLPRFGGISRTDKQTLDDDTTTTQPAFKRQEDFDDEYGDYDE
ncbi:MAG: hypothetical protein PHE55_08845 [Methylococcaceae bacterium]|nr:hypothetical protein [Methylococcaceae bacterium]